jgi:hypothetical protein
MSVWSVAARYWSDYKPAAAVRLETIPYPQQDWETTTLPPSLGMYTIYGFVAPCSICRLSQGYNRTYRVYQGETWTWVCAENERIEAFILCFTELQVSGRCGAREHNHRSHGVQLQRPSTAQRRGPVPERPFAHTVNLHYVSPCLSRGN